MNQSARLAFAFAGAALAGLLGTGGVARAADGVEEDGGIEGWVLEQHVPPTAEEELADVWRPGIVIHGDLRLHGQGFGGGEAVGVRIILEGEQLGFDGGYGGVFVREPDGRRTARGLLDLQLTFSPISTEWARVRLEAGLGALFTRCFDVAGPLLGASGEARLFGPLGLSGAARWVFWPYRSLDSHLAAQLWIGPYQLRAGVRRVSLEDAGQVGGNRGPETFLGPWLGVGMRM